MAGDEQDVKEELEFSFSSSSSSFLHVQFLLPFQSLLSSSLVLPGA